MEIVISIFLFIFLVWLFVGYILYRLYFDGDTVSIKVKGKKKKKLDLYKAYYEANDEAEFFDNKVFKMSIKSEDNVDLNGYLLRNKNSNTYIVLIHDFDGSHKEMRQNAIDFWRKGYNCLCVELKGYYMSKGFAKSLGFLDRLDILRWIERIKQSDEKAEFVLYGRGMGGACALYTICEDNKDIKAVITDGAYGSLKNVLIKMLGYKRIFYPIINVLVSFVLGFRIKDADVKDYLGSVDTPVLFIQGDKDEIVNMKMFDELYNLKKNN